jgi:hypothetical protein
VATLIGLRSRQPDRRHEQGDQEVDDAIGDECREESAQWDPRGHQCQERCLEYPEATGNEAHHTHEPSYDECREEGCERERKWCGQKDVQGPGGEKPVRDAHQELGAGDER